MSAHFARSNNVTRLMNLQGFYNALTLAQPYGPRMRVF